MSAFSSGAASGGVFAICLLVLSQQFGYLSLSDFAAGILLLILFIVAFVIIGGVAGRQLHRWATRKAAGLQEWKEKPPTPPSGTTTPPPAGGETAATPEAETPPPSGGPS